MQCFHANGHAISARRKTSVWTVYFVSNVLSFFSFIRCKIAEITVKVGLPLFIECRVSYSNFGAKLQFVYLFSIWASGFLLQPMLPVISSFHVWLWFCNNFHVKSATNDEQISPTDTRASLWDELLISWFPIRAAKYQENIIQVLEVVESCKYWSGVFHDHTNIIHPQFGAKLRTDPCPVIRYVSWDKQ